MLLQNSSLRQHSVSIAFRALLAASVLFSCPCASCPSALAQTDPNQAAQTTSNSANVDPATSSKTWIVRDPATGRLYQQRLVPVTVPVTRWEAKTVEQTVYEPQVTTTVQQPAQPLYVPKTQYVMQPKVRGWWNPLKQPVQAYEFAPVTQWVPTPAAPQTTIAAQQWVPKQQKIVVYQPVQSIEVRQQLVQVELPQPTTVTANSLRPGMQPRAFAGNLTQPLLRLPFFATNEQARIARTQWPYNQQSAPSQIASNPARVPPITSQTATPPAAPPITPASSQPAPPSAQPPVLPPQYAANQYASNPYTANQPSPASSPAYLPPPQTSYTSGLRPIAPSFPPLPSIPVPRFATRPYNAPLQPVTSGSSAYTRDTLQSGMQPTVLR